MRIGSMDLLKKKVEDSKRVIREAIAKYSVEWKEPNTSIIGTPCRR